MNNDNYDADDDLTPEQVEDLVRSAVSELLNIAVITAELQATEEAAEDILVLCDLVAAYFELEAVNIQPQTEPKTHTRNQPIPGSIRTRNNPKFRVSDQRTPPREDD